jgi:hypothetical protein
MGLAVTLSDSYLPLPCACIISLTVNCDTPWTAIPAICPLLHDFTSDFLLLPELMMLQGGVFKRKEGSAWPLGANVAKKAL